MQFLGLYRLKYIFENKIILLLEDKSHNKQILKTYFKEYYFNIF